MANMTTSEVLSLLDDRELEALLTAVNLELDQRQDERRARRADSVGPPFTDYLSVVEQQCAAASASAAARQLRHAATCQRASNASSADLPSQPTAGPNDDTLDRKPSR